MKQVRSPIAHFKLSPWRHISIRPSTEGASKKSQTVYRSMLHHYYKAEPELSYLKYNIFEVLETLELFWYLNTYWIHLQPEFYAITTSLLFILSIKIYTGYIKLLLD